MFEEYKPYPINDFKGLWKRGKDDSCPADHFMDGENFWFGEGSVKTRDGIEQILASGDVLRTHSYKRINESTRTLILKAGGLLYDSTNVSVAILTIAAMTDFSAVNIYNKVYISPHNGIKGLSGEKVYVWDGTTMRPAAGTAPTGTLVAVNSATTGNVEIGTHLFGVVFETASGFLSKPGPAIFAQVTATGTKKVDLSGIPIGPTGTVRRYIIATRSILTYNGNQFGQEYWFFDSGVINDNVTTTLTVNFYDSELQEDALYLFDILDVIPAGLVIGSYKGRMLVGNFDTNQFLLYGSIKNEPEVFDAVSSAIIVGPEDAGGITNVVEHRELLGITKSFHSYVTSDNGSEPNTWEVTSLDPGIGTEVHGISAILDRTGASTDRFFIASRGGLIMFDGSFKQPELTWKIEDLWLSINKDYFHKVQVAWDPMKKYIYCLVPLDAAISPSHIIFGDANEGLDYKKIRWSKWSFPNAPTSILVNIQDNESILSIASNAIYQQVEGRTDDNNITINNWIKCGFIPERGNGLLYHFNAITYRISGNGSIAVQLSGQDGSKIMTPPNFTLSASPGREITRKINYVGEKMSIRLDLTSFGEVFELNSMVAYHNSLWSQRANVI